jgi:hypothetical protein
MQHIEERRIHQILEISALLKGAHAAVGLGRGRNPCTPTRVECALTYSRNIWVK